MNRKSSISRLASVLLSLLIVFAITTRDLSAAVKTFDITVTYHQTQARSILDMMNEWRAGGVWCWNEGNTEKVDYGKLYPMAYDYDLEQIAMQRAYELIASWAHTRPDGSEWSSVMYNGTRSYGENIAIGYSSPEHAFDGWREEEEPFSGQGHRRSMASTSFTSVGIAYVEYEDITYWVQEFGFNNSNASETAALDGDKTVSIAADTGTLKFSAEFDGSFFYYNEICLADGPADLPEVSAYYRFANTWNYGTGIKLDEGEYEIKWESSDPSVLTVENGKFIPRKPGSADITAVVSSGGFSKKISRSYDVTTRDISLGTADFGNVTYTGNELKPGGKVIVNGKTLREGTDYKVTYEDNINRGYGKAIVTGIGAYSGTVEDYFEILPKDISKVVMPQIPDMVYTGNYIYPKFELKDGGKVLVYGSDYGFEITDNLDINTASIKIKGINNYTGIAIIPFNIIPRELNSDTTNIRCIAKQSYTGSAIEPNVSVTYEGVSLRKDIDYTVTYKDNVEIGTATYVVQGIGHFKGTMSGTFNIIGDSEVKEDKVMAFVERIYIFVLDREPEKEGAAFWTDELWNFRRSGAEVAQGFIFSDEFAARNTDDTEFVTILYQTFFGRSPEDEGLVYWTSQLASGAMDRVTVANGFIYSQEWADTCAMYGIRSGGDIVSSKTIKPTELTYSFVERMYTTAMGREFDREGREYWASLLANFELSGEDVGVSFFLSDEMVSYNLSDEEFLNRLYKTFMDRESDSEGAAYWLSVMASGSARADVVYGFTRSPEFTEKCVNARILPFK